MPAEGVAVECVLRGEILGAVLADDLDPGLGERAQVLGGSTYLVAATIVTSGPSSLRMRS